MCAYTCMHTYRHMNSNCVCVFMCVCVCHKVLRGDSVALHQSFLLDVDSREHEVCTIQSHSQNGSEASLKPDMPA